ncbi:MAG: GTPase HflX [Ruminococcaceae bacterium]|nr:GTPase HflX [Oscillospiraceae bacterium]
MEKKIYGKTDSLKKITIEYMESFIGECYSPGSFLPVEVMEMMQKITGENGDEVAVCLDRHNRVVAISYGDFRCVSVPELKIRRSDSRLCGIRFLHTHPLKSTSAHGIYPSEVDINTLRKERFDAMAVIGIYEKEILGITVTMLQRDQSGELNDYETVGPCKLNGASRFDSLYGQIKSLDKYYSKTSQEVADSNEKAILVGVIDEKTEGSDAEILSELKELAESAGATVVASYTQRRKAPNAGTYIGAGFAKDLSLKRQALSANLVIFDDELTPTQIRNLENIVGTRVIDRTALILDIFAARAKSVEGKYQVELAQQKYRLPRLTGLGTVLSRLGGGIGTRGPGETKLEEDKRHIRRKIYYLEDKLKEITTRRSQMRAERQKNNVPTVAIVGYTNAGKSTLMNYMCDTDVIAEDKLFATLDTSVRRMVNEDKQDVLMIDTVGFIKKLPTDLIEAFKATLEESVYADLLLHVIDVSSKDAESCMQTVEDILDKIGATDSPRMLVFNKIDKGFYADIRPNPRNYPGYDKVFFVSSVTGEGIKELKEAINDFFTDNMYEFECNIPYSDMKLINFLHDNCEKIEEEYTDKGVRVKGTIPEKYAYAIKEL